MVSRSLALLAAVSLAGCASNGGNSPKLTAQEETPTELAAYAGHASYPTTMPASQNLEAAAIVGPGKRVIKIYNFSADAIRDADVWVNGAFVQHIPGIAPQSSVMLRSDQIYNSMGKNFSSQDEPVSRVQLQLGNALYTLWGPAAE